MMHLSIFCQTMAFFIVALLLELRRVVLELDASWDEPVAPFTEQELAELDAMGVFTPPSEDA